MPYTSISKGIVTVLNRQLAVNLLRKGIVSRTREYDVPFSQVAAVHLQQ